MMLPDVVSATAPSSPPKSRSGAAVMLQFADTAAATVNVVVLFAATAVPAATSEIPAAIGAIIFLRISGSSSLLLVHGGCRGKRILTKEGEANREASQVLLCLIRSGC